MTSPSATPRVLALLSHFILIVGFTAAAGKLGIVMALPLLALLPGLWRGKPYVYAVASLVIVLYLGGCLMEAFAQPSRRQLAIGFAFVTMAEFCALVFYVRLRATEMRRLAAQAPEPEPPVAEASEPGPAPSPEPAQSPAEPPSSGQPPS